MSGFEVQINQLHAAAKAAASAAAQARAVEPGTGLDVIATALPGGSAASCAPALVTAFNDRARGWAGEIDRWSTSIEACATTYSKSEDEAAKAFS